MNLALGAGGRVAMVDLLATTDGVTNMAPKLLWVGIGQIEQDALGRVFFLPMAEKTDASTEWGLPLVFGVRPDSDVIRTRIRVDAPRGLSLYDEWTEFRTPLDDLHICHAVVISHGVSILVVEPGTYLVTLEIAGEVVARLGIPVFLRS